MKKLCSVSLWLSLFLIVVTTVKASSVDIVVHVGLGPSFSISPKEQVSSTTTSPIPAGESITFTATATNVASRDYYFINCKTDEIEEGNGTNPIPSCPGGAWCVSGATASGSEASCSYQTTVADNQTNEWYGFACDTGGTGLCSSSDQGTGGSGSPFYINRPPNFSGIDEITDKEPGDIVSWSVNASDADTIPAPNLVKLIVCKSDGFTNGLCGGGDSDTWCTSDFVSSDPSCNITIPSPFGDGEKSAFVYIVDDLGLQSNSELQGTSASFSVNNIFPQLSSLVINDGFDIELLAGTSKEVIFKATVADTNTCSNEIESVGAYFYRSSVGYENCREESDANSGCYPDITCTPEGSSNSCDGGSDTSVEYLCTADLGFYTDPTDLDTPYEAENWMLTIVATDNNEASVSSEIKQGVEVLSIIAFDTDSAINYGTLSVGQKIDPISSPVAITAYGNVGLDIAVNGNPLANQNGDTIPVTSQRYATSIVPFADALSLAGSPSFIDLNIPKPINNLGSVKRIYWGIEVPDYVNSGEYKGSNRVTALKGDLSGW